MIDPNTMAVLIADDMENMCITIRNIMKILKLGNSFFFAANGEEALEVLQKEKIDLAILDYNMPKMTGLELLEIIRNDSELQDMPVVMLTAHAEKDFITRAAELDINAYVLKPITVNLLKEKIPPVIEKVNYPPPMISYLRRARKMAEMGNFIDAIEQTRRAMETNPKSTRPLREAGEYLTMIGKDDEAEKYLKKATEMNNIDVIAFSRLGDLYMKADELDKALACYKKAMAVSPLHYKHGLQVGKILIKKKMMEKAMPVFKNVIELSKDSSVIKEEIADICLENGAKEYAVEILKDLVEAHPDRGDLITRYNSLSSDVTKGNKTVTELLEKEKLEPDNIGIKLDIAKIYIDIGQRNLAERPLKAALKLDPEQSEAHALLEKISEKR